MFGVRGFKWMWTLRWVWRPFTTPTKALHTNLRPFTLISGRPRPLKDLHTHLWHSMPFLGAPTIFFGHLLQPSALYTNLRPSFCKINGVKCI